MNMNKLFILLVFSVGINATAQVATSGTTNSGATASAIGLSNSQQQVELLLQQWEVKH